MIALYSRPRRSFVARVGLLFLLAAIHFDPASALARVAPATLRLPAQPPAFGYQLVNAFGALTFTDPVAITTPRGETNRLFVVEQDGRIILVPDLANPTRVVFLNIVSRVSGGVPNNEQGLLGLAFHPGYATNGFFFVFYCTNDGSQRNRLSRFRVDPADPNRADPNSEVVLINQIDQAGNHNGGDLHFGPDDYLYVSLGDEGGGNDQYNNSQRIDGDFFAGMLRIDVDSRPGSLEPNPHAAVSGNYRVPPDNPWVGATSFNGRTVDPARVRTEFWAVGLRNPWRFSFDPATGMIYAGDVGQNALEEVDRIERGDNHGWAYREGTRNGPKSSSAPAGFQSVRPWLEYGRGNATNQGFSVTGGLVYRGNNLSQLHGSYVFADYVSGHVWAARDRGESAGTFTHLLTDTGISAFGVDPANGDVLVADQNQDTLKRLVYTSASTGTPFPETLADTGAFSDLASLTPQPGIIPYDLNLPFWSDGASKRRWFALPESAPAIRLARDQNPLLPTGTVWVKHFEIELTPGQPATRRRLETRFLVKTAADVYGITYRWDASQSNAFLVSEQGLDEPLTFTENGVSTTRNWRYPSRADCLRCHTAAAGHALGFSLAQLNRADPHSGDPTVNQLSALAQAGYVSIPNLYPNSVFKLPEPQLANPDDEEVSLEFRARSYLAVNCAPCHQPGGGAVAYFDTRLEIPTDDTGLLNGTLRDQLGDPLNRVIAPGSALHSMLLRRMNVRDSSQMPPIGSNHIDARGAELLRRWIVDALPARLDAAAWTRQQFADPTDPAAAADADPDQDRASNYAEFLAGTRPLDPADAWRLHVSRDGANHVLSFVQPPDRTVVIEASTDIFDPASWRPLEDPNAHPLPSSAARQLSIPIAPPADSARFYRARLSPL